MTFDEIDGTVHLTFDETLALVTAKIDATIADDLVALERRVRDDLAAPAEPDVPRPPGWIDANVAVVIEGARVRLHAWREHNLLRYALTAHTPTTRPC